MLHVKYTIKHVFQLATHPNRKQSKQRTLSRKLALTPTMKPYQGLYVSYLVERRSR